MKSSATTIAELAKQVAVLAAEGRSRKEIAKQLDLTYGKTCDIVRANNIKIARETYVSQAWVAQRALIIKVYTEEKKSGHIGALARAGQRLNLTRERVRQVVKSAGLPSAQAISRQKAKAAELEKKAESARKAKAAQEAKLAIIGGMEQGLRAGLTWGQAAASVNSTTSGWLSNPQAVYRALCLSLGRVPVCRFPQRKTQAKAKKAESARKAKAAQEAKLAIVKGMEQGLRAGLTWSQAAAAVNCTTPGLLRDPQSVYRALCRSLGLVPFRRFPQRKTRAKAKKAE